MLGTLDEGLTQLGPRINDLQDKLDAAVELDQELASDSRLDLYFRVPAFFERLIPAAQQDRERAESAGREGSSAGHESVCAGRSAKNF